jgi:hypothetical protein
MFQLALKPLKIYRGFAYDEKQTDMHARHICVTRKPNPQRLPTHSFLIVYGAPASSAGAGVPPLLTARSLCSHWMA